MKLMTMNPNENWFEILDELWFTWIMFVHRSLIYIWYDSANYNLKIRCTCPSEIDLFVTVYLM
jgi:hypothetical protein